MSLATTSRKSDDDLRGLVYSLTPKIVDHNQPFYLRPAVVGTVLLIACAVLNYEFW
jgi:SSS family solute:Na+ symporter